MEKGAAGGDPARAAVGVCEKLLTFFSKNLSMTRQKAITDGPRTGAGSDNRDKDRSKEDEEDEFMVKIERAEFEFREEEEEQKKSFTTATILGGPSTDLRSSAGASDLQQQPKEAPLKAAAADAAVADDAHDEHGGPAEEHDGGHAHGVLQGGRAQREEDRRIPLQVPERGGGPDRVRLPWELPDPRRVRQARRRRRRHQPAQAHRRQPFAVGVLVSHG